MADSGMPEEWPARRPPRKQMSGQIYDELHILAAASWLRFEESIRLCKSKHGDAGYGRKWLGGGCKSNSQCVVVSDRSADR